MNHITSKLNFKKITIWYLILGIIAGLVSVLYLGDTYREKITFAYEFHTLKEQTEEAKTFASQGLENRLTSFASRYPSIYDVLILDNRNHISYSAKNSDFATMDLFTLTPRNHQAHGILVLNGKPNIGFKVMEDGKQIVWDLMKDKANEYHSEYLNETFFEPGLRHKTIYTLSYLVNDLTGERVFIIQNNMAVPNGLTAVKIVAATAALFFMLYWVLLALWVYEHARRLKLNASLWGIITLFTNLAGLFIFLLYRQSLTICKLCGSLQSKGNVYCSSCGNQLSESCRNCGKMLESHDKYCPSCGKALEKSDS